MKDNELRAIVLQKYYDLRRLGTFQWVEIPEDQCPAVENFDELARISSQLAEHGLIEWKPTQLRGHAIGGFGKITAFGVDVIEGTARAPITITFKHGHTVNVNNSSNVQIGDDNSISSLLKIKELNTAIDHSEFSAQEKAEAKSLLSKFLEHPVTAAILGGLASTVK